MSENPELSDSAVAASREVRAVVSRVRRRIMKVSEAEDITLGQGSVLARVADKGGLTASELAASEGMRHQSMTAMVASLAAAGLVDRTPDPGDGRRLLITLTPEGRRRVAEGRQARTEWLAARLRERCTEEERQAVIAAMTLLERVTRD